MVGLRKHTDCMSFDIFVLHLDCFLINSILEFPVHRSQKHRPVYNTRGIASIPVRILGKQKNIGQTKKRRRLKNIYLRTTLSCS
jgi:hypothetical protein